MSEFSGQKIAVVGAGPVGLLTALMLTNAKVPVVLFGKPAGADPRTFALWQGALSFFGALNVLGILEAESTPIRRLEIYDVTSGLLPIPPFQFDCQEVGQDRFGLNIRASYLTKTLAECLARQKLYKQIDDEVHMLEKSGDGFLLHIRGHQPFYCDLLVGADGAQSLVRKSLGITVSQKKLEQYAIVAEVECAVQHENTSIELHHRGGPFALVPLEGTKCAIVCVLSKALFRTYSAFSPAQLESAFEERSNFVLGRMKLVSKPGSFPLQSAAATCTSGKNFALLGEAAHTMPPIGAQGLNLGIRDVAALMRQVVPGAGAHKHLVLNAGYEAQRMADVKSRSAAVDMLNATLLDDYPLARLARAPAALAVNRFKSLRTRVLRAGIS